MQIPKHLFPIVPFEIKATPHETIMANRSIKYSKWRCN